MKHDPITAASLRKQAVPACSKCNSPDVRIEAFAEWNENVQQWRVKELLDGNSVCNACGQQCEIKWRLA